MSVTRFSSEPVNQAILRASYARSSRARSSSRAVSPLRFLMVTVSLSSINIGYCTFVDTRTVLPRNGRNRQEIGRIGIPPSRLMP